MATAVAPQWKSVPATLGSGSLGSGPLGIGGRRVSPSPPNSRHRSSTGSGHVAGGLSAARVTVAKDTKLCEISLSEAPHGRCEYYSTTHQNWIPAKITDTDEKTGACQIDKKPGVWISPGEQKSRLRVTTAALERAAKEAGQSSRKSASPTSSAGIQWPSAAAHSLGDAAVGETSTAGELGETSNLAPHRLAAPRTKLPGHERPTIFSTDSVAEEPSLRVRYSGSRAGGSNATQSLGSESLGAALGGRGEASRSLGPGRRTSPRRLSGSSGKSLQFPRATTPVWENAPSQSSQPPTPLSQPLAPSHLGATQLPTPVSQSHTPVHLGETKGFNLKGGSLSGESKYVCTIGTAEFSWETPQSTQLSVAKGAELGTGSLSGETHRGVPPAITHLSGSPRVSKAAWEGRPVNNVGDTELIGLVSEAQRVVLSQKYTELPCMTTAVSEALAAYGADGTELLASGLSTEPRQEYLTPLQSSMRPSSGPPQSFGPSPGVTLVSSVPAASSSSRGASAAPVATESGCSQPVAVVSGTPLLQNVQGRLSAWGEGASEASTATAASTKDSNTIFNIRSSGVGGGLLGPSAQGAHTPLAAVSATDQAPPVPQQSTTPLLVQEDFGRAGQQLPGVETAEASNAGSVASGLAASSLDPRTSNRSADPPHPLPLGDTIAFDEYGRPTIIRQINAENGAARTIVLNIDGSHRVFGEHTVASLTNSNKDETKSWIDALSCHQLRGLVHEVGQRLLEGSRLYHARLNQLEKMGENLNYTYFGLSAEASDKDLDIAYRKLARKMHPDKNGGTESAKKRFQQMKERYEAIKKKRIEECGDCDSDDSAPVPESDEEEGATRKLKDRKFKDKDEDNAAANNAEEEAADKASSIEYDPKDRDSMEKTVGKMLGQLKNVEIQMKVVVKELGRIATQIPSTCEE